ncbi:MAG: NifB/NifX family molybdenum-iron cluster-binding protein [Oscillospiraceae bacterium]|jgi:predicted Fe-Mo cluster-binding NifX family protein|nr:NifB/NifX family molybdenum-iron cluster-binding protein [Oscillospiraceae bacterium]
MKVAVTYENGQVFQHFGRTEYFKLYDAEEGRIISASIINTGTNGHGALAGFLKDNGVDALICGGIGEGARKALSEAGIVFYGGVTGTADEAVTDLLANKLAFDPDIVCSHHGAHHHEEDHDCGSHNQDE